MMGGKKLIKIISNPIHVHVITAATIYTFNLGTKSLPRKESINFS